MPDLTTAREAFREYMVENSMDARWDRFSYRDADGSSAMVEEAFDDLLLAAHAAVEHYAAEWRVDWQTIADTLKRNAVWAEWRTEMFWGLHEPEPKD